MNNNISALEQKYPLSPKKFWKKFLPSAIYYFFIISFLMFVPLSIFLTSGIVSGGFMVFFALASVFVIMLLIYSWYIKTYIKTYYYSADKDFITIKKGVFTPAEIHVQYAKIQDVYVDQDLLDRMFGLYDVHIASATIGSAIEAHIDGVDAENAEGLKNLLLESIRSGGVGNSVNNISSQSMTDSQPLKINLAENFSSDTYPINPKWTYKTILESINVSLLICLVVPMMLYFPGKDGTKWADLFHPSMFNILEIYILSSALLFTYFLISSLLWKRNYKFEFTPEYIFLHQGVIGMREIHVPYSTVQDVTVSQTIGDRIFGIYSVNIQNAALGSSIGIPGQSLEKATKISDFIKSILSSKNTGRTGL